MTEQLEGQFKIQVLDIYIGDRKRKDLGDIEDMMKDLVENGQLQPILVRPPTEVEQEHISEPWILVAGGRRLASAMRLGWMEIAAFVRHDPIDEVRHRVMELHENLKRKEMTWQEEADAKNEILKLRQIEDPNLTAGDVAAEIGDSKATFSRAVAASEAMEKRPELRQASSRKAALRASDVADHLEARKRVDEESKSAIEELEQRVLADDAVNFLQKYDNFFDVIVSDPPYGIEFWKQGQKTDAETNLSEYDDSQAAAYALYKEMFPAMAKAMRTTGWVLLFGSAESYRQMEDVWRNTCRIHKSPMNLFMDTDQSLRCEEGRHSEVRCEGYQPEIIPWIWYRPNSRNPARFPELHAQNVYEYILVVNMGDALLAKPTGNLFVHDAEYGNERFHGNQKPIELIADLLSVVSYPGDRFCDPCFGSGAHLAAAASLSMHCYGCDLNPSLRSIALGLVAKHFKPIPPSVRDLSETRFKRRLGELTFGITEGPAATS